VAFDRVWSILFYIVVAIGTCLLAARAGVCQEKQNQGNCRGIAWDFQYRLFLAGIFAILFLLSALRFDIGNDYRQYTQTAHEASVGGYVVTEIGFNMLVKLVYWLTGGEYYEVVFALFAAVTLYFFLKSFARQSADFAWTFFLFMTLGLFFQTFNTVRYYLALSIALYSMKYVLDRDYIRFVFWILAAALFHKSVLLVLPVYWIATFEWKKWQIVAGLAVSAACYAGKGLILKLALLLYPSYRNTIYLEGGTSWGSILRILAVLALYLWFCRYSGGMLKDEIWYRELRFYGQLNLLAFVASTFFSFLPVVTRIVYYFGVSQLLLIPLIICNIKDTEDRKKVELLVFVLCMLNFIVFLLQAHRDGVGLLPYKSWLFEQQRFLYK